MRSQKTADTVNPDLVRQHLVAFPQREQGAERAINQNFELRKKAYQFALTGKPLHLYYVRWCATSSKL